MKYAFDPPETGWSTNAQAIIGAVAGAPTPPNALQMIWGIGGVPACWRTLTGLVNGQQYELWVSVNFDGMDANTPYVMITYADGAGGDFAIGKNTVPAGWRRKFLGYITGAATDRLLRFNGSLEAGFLGTAYIDEIWIGETPPPEEEMAVMLTEMAVRSVLSRVQTALNTEIGYVKSEAALGFDLPQVTGWRAYDAGIATPDVVEFEAYEIGDTVFPSESYDQSMWSSGNRTRVLSKTPMRAAINHANRGDSDAAGATLLASQMAERSRLYGAALVRCFRNDPTCGQAATVTIVPRSVRYNVRNASRLTDDIRRAARVEFDFDVHLQESSINETVPGGASLPSVTQETP